MAEYSKEEIRRIEEKWRKRWADDGVYKTEMDPSKPKYYALDMFPYPSGAGLHVGHPLGYIACDIVARYKRVKGFNVLHPMGFDAFGLPAEQYAIEHGIPPRISTEKNIANFKEQLGKIGFCYDWSREVQTCDPSYYKWTQWIFLQIFDSWYNRKKQKAERISALISIFEKEGNLGYPFPGSKFRVPGSEKNLFSATEWKSFSDPDRQKILMEYRLAYLAFTDVNWCEALGTVLANDEVINGVSYRGGFPVVKRQMRQWSLRITEYAERLLSGLDVVDFSDSMKEIQRNWIGKSQGALIDFEIDLTPSPSPKERGTVADHVFTTDSSTWAAVKDRVHENRRNPTPAEEAFWDAVRNDKLGHHIRRQHAIHQYIVDFVCIEKNLVIEIDGPIHEKQKESDKERTLTLQIEGFKVIRFTNEEVLNDLPRVLNEVRGQLSAVPFNRERSPSPQERGSGGEVITVFTTRPDTIFGVDFMVVAPEHEIVKKITSDAQKAEVEKYLEYVKSRSEVDRMAEVKKVTGCFTGAYALNPFNKKKLAVWISEYVLAGYGTGAIMGVPSGDERDHKFAKHFKLPITNIIGKHYTGEEANPTFDATLENSEFLNGIVMREAIDVVIKRLEEIGVGKRQIQYKMRDAGWSRQRYWGEPFPVVFRDDMPFAMDVKDLPLELPDLDNFKSAGTGEGPLANLKDWIQFKPNEKRDSNTMPTHAGAAWYFLRYMDPHNAKEFASRKTLDYWGQVDVYIGGSEHAVAHLLYSRLWVKILHDLGYMGFDEPFKKLINQGKITGESEIFREIRPAPYWLNNHKHEHEIILNVYKGDRRIAEFSVIVNKSGHNRYVSYYSTDLTFKYQEVGSKEFIPTIIHEDRADVRYREIDGETHFVNIEDWLKDQPYYNPIIFTDDGYWHYEKHSWVPFDAGKSNPILRFETKPQVEKLSKSYRNVVNPDDIVEKYGADTLRMYEMFLGPLEQSKPWSTNGIDGVYKFLRRFWNLFHDNTGKFIVSTETASREELKALHKTLKKVSEDIESFSFNTSVSEFMICVNELTTLKCNKRSVLEPLVIALSPFAPHIAEELWSLLDNKKSILFASYPAHDENYLKKSSHLYPISVNGKVRAEMEFATDTPKEDIEKLVLASELVRKWTEGKAPKKVIIVPGKIVNVVV